MQLVEAELVHDGAVVLTARAWRHVATAEPARAYRVDAATGAALRSVR